MASLPGSRPHGQAVFFRADEPFGVLALASEDAQRFYPEMGTVYLKRIGEIAARMMSKRKGMS
mgnify:CR=1 FL=1